MTRTVLAALAMTASLLVACSAEPDQSAPDGPDTPPVAAPTSSPPIEKETRACPELTADVPSDLDRRRARQGPGEEIRSSRVTFSKDGLTREVSLAAAATDQVYGHGFPGPRSDTEVQGRPATHIQVSDDTEVYQWQVEDAPGDCPYWTVTTVGLTGQEMTKTVESVALALR